MPIRTLIVTGLTDVHHDWQAATPALERVLEETGRFGVRVMGRRPGGPVGRAR